MEYQSEIRSLIIWHRLDSFSMPYSTVFGWSMDNQLQTKSERLRESAEHLMDELRQKLERGYEQDWSLVASAVSHEMTDQIAQNIRSVSSKVGDLFVYFPNGRDRYIPANKLILEMNKLTTLTTLEEKYLKSLLREIGEMTLSPIDHHS